MISRPWDSGEKVVVREITKGRGRYFKIYQVVGVRTALQFSFDRLISNLVSKIVNKDFSKLKSRSLEVMTDSTFRRRLC